MRPSIDSHCSLKLGTRTRTGAAIRARCLLPGHHGSGILVEAHAAGSAVLASSWIALADGAAGGGSAFMRTGGARGAGTYGGCEGGGGAAGT